MTGIADLKAERAKALKALKCRAHGGRADRTAGRESALWPARYEALTELAWTLIRDEVSVTRGAVANRLFSRLSNPENDYERELAGRVDLWPERLPSRPRFREMIANMTDDEWSGWT